jgi:hypothetical protein
MVLLDLGALWMHNEKLGFFDLREAKYPRDSDRLVM